VSGANRLKKVALIIFPLALGVVALAAHFSDAGANVVAAPSDVNSQTQSVVDVTNAFLQSLNADQRQKARFAFTSQKSATAATFKRSGAPPPESGEHKPPPQSPGNPAQAPSGPSQAPGKGPGFGPPGGFVGEKYGDAVWSNYPVSDVPRPGLQLGSLTSAQRDAAMHLLQILLSHKGYQKVLDIMGSDQALADAGTNFASGAAVYTIAVFGSPSATEPFMLEFGGHHLALNIVIAGARGVGTPTLTGAQPSVYTANGKTIRVLAAENDKAFALLNAFNDAQRKQAILNYRIDDLVAGPGHAGQAIQPEGLKASAMTEKQKSMLLDLVSEWAGIINDAYAAPHLAQIKSALDETYFAWSGPTTHEPNKNGSAYYRIQGPDLIIEFSPQGVGGDPTNHVHTMYRDPTNDYGVGFTLTR
jgi:hypothetical protein